MTDDGTQYPTEPGTGDLFSTAVNTGIALRTIGDSFSAPRTGPAHNVAGIDAAEADILRQKLLDIPGVNDVRVFGSRTLGTSTAASDLDVLLIGDVDTTSATVIDAMKSARSYAKEIGIGPGSTGNYIDPQVYESMSQATNPNNWRPITPPTPRFPTMLRLK